MIFVVLNKNESSFFNFKKTRFNLINEYYYLNIYDIFLHFLMEKSEKFLEIDK